MATLLVVDDEPSICWGIRRLGESLGHEVLTASSAEQALEIVSRRQPSAIVLDVRLPGMSGLKAMQRLRQLGGDAPIIVITAFGDLETAVEAVRNGAFEYIVKPFDLEKVERVLGRALATQPAISAVARPAGELAGIVGRSAPMQEVFKNMALAAASDANLLLFGESGTGKELVARAVHAHSRRARGPFVAVNVASLSPSLCESELFGHARGAFTGAEQAREGLLVQADGGTLFLDEVADIPLSVQVKLLRAVEYGEVRPVGANQSVKTNFRVLSATHQNLLDMVGAGTFRHDLYFRLAAFRIDLPPLRERREDVPALVEYFLTATARASGTGVPAITREALDELAARPWYGNVRELRNVVEHAAIVARGAAIHREHLPPPIASLGGTQATGAPSVEGQIEDLIRRWSEAKLLGAQEGDELYEQLLRLIEPAFLRTAMSRFRGQCATAAPILGLHRTTLRKKIEHYGIEVE